MAKKPRYTAIVLRPIDTEEAIWQAKANCVDATGDCPLAVAMGEMCEWEIIAHHATICMGGIPAEWAHRLGDVMSLEIDGVGLSDKALALRVKKNSIAGRFITNSIPHITIAVNRKDGGKPFDSNKIPVWHDIKFDDPNEAIILNGIVTEIF